MQVHQAAEKIRDGLIDSGRDTRYKLEAYLFVMNGLEYYLAKIGEKRHVSGAELSRGLMDCAVKHFGALTRDVLGMWGIHATGDFGYIVYNLIELGQMSRRPEDSLEDFFGVLDIDAYCAEQDYFAIDKKYIARIQGA